MSYVMVDVETDGEIPGDNSMRTAGNPRSRSMRIYILTLRFLKIKVVLEVK